MPNRHTLTYLVKQDASIGTSSSILIRILTTVWTVTVFQAHCAKQLVFSVHMKSENLQYNTLGHWVDRFINQGSDGPSIILIDCK